MRSAYMECGPFAAPGSTQQRIRTHEVDVLEVLLFSDDCSPWSRARLERVIGGNPLDLSDALHNLAVAGLIHLSENSVTLSRVTRVTMQSVSEALAVSAPCAQASHGTGSGVCRDAGAVRCRRRQRGGRERCGHARR